MRFVILNSSALYAQAWEALWGSMLVAAIATIVSAMAERDADAEGLWLVPDEARQLGGVALERIQTIEEVARSRGMRVVLGLQDAQQLEAAVGREKAGPMVSMQSTRFHLRSAPTAAEQIAHTVGDREIKRITNTAMTGAVQGKKLDYERVPVRSPELQRLRGHSGSQAPERSSGAQRCRSRHHERASRCSPAGRRQNPRPHCGLRRRMREHGSTLPLNKASDNLHTSIP